MYWLQRPPYLRWAAAAILVVGAALWDLRPEPTRVHPFLTAPVSAGEPIDAADVEWRTIPTGLLAEPDLTHPIAAVDLSPGTALAPEMLRAPVVAPEGWWEVPVAVGGHASAGDQVMLVVIDPPTTVAGLVVTAQRGDPYSLDYRPASVAVPADSAALIAAASAQGTVVAAVRPGGEYRRER